MTMEPPIYSHDGRQLPPHLGSAKSRGRENGEDNLKSSDSAARSGTENGGDGGWSDPRMAGIYESMDV